MPAGSLAHRPPLAGGPRAAEDATAGPPLLAKAFRPFFLLAGLAGAAAVPLWLLALAGAWAPVGWTSALGWHAHEMVFGVIGAVLLGFLLTASATWTGREVLRGAPLGALAGLWLVARAAAFVPGAPPLIGVGLSALPFALAAAALARVVIGARSWRNLGFVPLLLGLAGADLAHGLGGRGLWPGQGPALALRVALDLVVVAMVVMASRVVPMFTRNATRDAGIMPRPAWQRAAILAAVAVVGADALGFGRAAALLAGLTAALGLVASWRWGAWSARTDPLLWVLFAGWGWVLLGLGLRAAGGLGLGVPDPAWLHALTTGAMGTLVLGMMSRVTLGHTGRMLAATRPVAVSFVLITLAALVRVASPWLLPHLGLPVYWVAAVAWSAAFALFVVVHAPMLLAVRVDGRPG